MGVDTPIRREKGERTRGRILDAALDLFRDQGYESTTMRAIAEAAGVAVGNTYHYFPSKDHLVQAFYERVHVDRVEAARDPLAGERELRRRIAVAMQARLDVVRPYHAVSATLFRTAADPRSPLNPFSAASEPTRRACIEFWREVVDGSGARLAQDVRAALPHLLWLYELGIIFFWLHDPTPGQRRTDDFVADTIEAMMRMLSLANLPGIRAVRRRMLRWLPGIQQPAS
jgi:AcrR family transcriptional regulator